MSMSASVWVQRPKFEWKSALTYAYSRALAMYNCMQFDLHVEETTGSPAKKHVIDMSVLSKAFNADA